MKTKLNINYNHKQLVKRIVADGWFIKRSSGKHIIYAHSSKVGNIIIQPFHRGDVSPGLVRKALALIDQTA
jgi:predicted RNA binding protein YcfA (HicA-like mRNA interferase family)